MCVCVCVCVSARARACVFVYVCAYARACVRVCVRTRVRACVHTRMYVRDHVCTKVCVSRHYATVATISSFPEYRQRVRPALVRGLLIRLRHWRDRISNILVQLRSKGLSARAQSAPSQAPERNSLC